MRTLLALLMMTTVASADFWSDLRTPRHFNPNAYNHDGRVECLVGWGSRSVQDHINIRSTPRGAIVDKLDIPNNPAQTVILLENKGEWSYGTPSGELKDHHFLSGWVLSDTLGCFISYPPE
jgi:hypothetical protein